jgi:D-glycero-beta-D-manno-heptose-7-phosphate kinase
LNLELIVKSIKKKKVLLIGDFLLDTYTEGDVERISPEAPVPVLLIKGERSFLGGSGNVLENLRALGGEVFALGRVGCDRAGSKILEILDEKEMNHVALLEEEDYKTPHKNRMVSNGHQLLRVDHEEAYAKSSTQELKLIEKMKGYLEEVDVVVLSDYGKGLLSPSFLKEIIASAKNLKIPVLCDPKGNCYKKYAGVTLLKPNKKEAYEALGLAKSAPLEDLRELLKVADARALYVTLGSSGASIFIENQRRIDVPTEKRSVIDVTGAGDTVLALLAMAFANRIPLYEAAILANLAAGLAVEKFGCACITHAQLLEAARQKDEVEELVGVYGK